MLVLALPLKRSPGSVTCPSLLVLSFSFCKTKRLGNYDLWESELLSHLMHLEVLWEEVRFTPYLFKASLARALHFPPCTCPEACEMVPTSDKRERDIVDENCPRDTGYIEMRWQICHEYTPLECLTLLFDMNNSLSLWREKCMCFQRKKSNIITQETITQMWEHNGKKLKGKLMSTKPLVVSTSWWCSVASPHHIPTRLLIKWPLRTLCLCLGHWWGKEQR